MGSKEMIKLSLTTAVELPEYCRNKLLKVALSILQSSNQIRHKSLEKVSQEYDITQEKVYEYLGLYIFVIKLFLDLNVNDFTSKLLELGFPEVFINDLPLLATNREKIFKTILKSTPSQQGLDQLNWCIDLSLQTSTLSKKNTKSVILCFCLNNGRKVTINLDIKTFHKLRFNVCLILKHLMNIKDNHALKKLP